MTREHRIDAEALLAHADWMRALAFSLLRDPAAADDVVQEATVAALLHAPADDAGLEPWLSRVVRNFAFRRRRGEARRAEHEARARSSASEPSPADTLERLELQRTLVEAVGAIEEPLRTTLVLRYFEGLSCAEIARSQRVPAGTVRWRLKRALEELRAKLDARSGSRAAWVALMTPFAARPNVATTGGGGVVTSSHILTGVLAMKTAQLMAIAVAMAIIGGIALWSFDGSRDQPDVASIAIVQQPAVALSGDQDATAKDAHEREAETSATRASAALVATPAPEAHTETASPAAEPAATVDARFVDAHGAPWSNVMLTPLAVEWLAGWNPGAGVLSGTDGRASLHIALPAHRAETLTGGAVQIELSASRAGCATARLTATLRAGETAHLGDVVLGPGVRIIGRATDETGAGVALATIGVAPAELSDDPGYMRRHGSKSFSRVPSAVSTPDGAFTIEGIPPGTLRLWAHADGKRFTWSAPIEVRGDHDLLGFEIALSPLLATDRIVGRIVGPKDQPVSHAQLTYFEHSKLGGISTGTNADAEGRFELLVRHDDSTYDFTAQDSEERFASTTIEGVVPGSLDVVIRLRDKRLQVMRVHDSDGHPIADATFAIEARGFESGERATTSRIGDYAIALPDGKFRLTVGARHYRSRNMRSLEAATLPAELDVVLQRAPAIRGRVLADGVPIAGARVSLVHDSPDARGTVAGFRFRYMDSHGRGDTRSDAEGRYEIDCDEDGGFWLRAMLADWAPGEVGPLDAAQLGAQNDFDIQLTKGGTIEGRVLLPGGRDGEGTVIALNHGDGSPRTLRAGPKGFFHVEGLAPGKWQVLPAEKEIDPGLIQYSSTKSDAPMEWSCEVSSGRTTHFDLDLSKP